MSDETRLIDDSGAEPMRTQAQTQGHDEAARADMREAEPAAPSRLRDAMRRARMNEAERRDVIVSLRDSELARLELLQEAVADVFAEVPADSDLFAAQIMPGTPPRMWVDVLAYVEMGRDRRTYRFVQEARHGRHVLLETTDVEDMSDRITDYVAHRLLERKRALASEELALAQARLYAGEPDAATTGDAPDEAVPDDTSGAGPFSAPPPAEAPRPVRRGASGAEVFAVFLLGALAGAAALFVYGVSRFPG